mgnify:FL=1
MIICLILYLILLIFYISIRNNIISIKLNKYVFKKASIVFLCVLSVAFLVELWNMFADNTVTKIERNSYGERAETDTYKVEIDGKTEEILDIQVAPRSYTEQELQGLYLSATKVLETSFLGQNTSAEHVTEKLSLSDSIEGYPFRIRWEMSRYDVVDSTGQLHQNVIEKVDTENRGVPVTLTAILQYGSKSFSFSEDIVVYAEKEEILSEKEKLENLVADIEDESREDAYVELPEMLDGKKLVWRKVESTKTIPLLLVGSAVSFFFLYSEIQKERKEKQKREKQMLFDYPEIVSQFTVLISAGMSTKNAWKKIVEDYRKQKARTGRERWAYEEMFTILQEMQSGIPEAECYAHFVERANLMPYMKLGALLLQNLRKGTKGMWAMLEVEACQSLEERKNQVKKLGEEAGTKLLLPMLLMLIVVLLIVMVPAFVSIQI